MQFIGCAITWLQSSKVHEELENWEEFSEAVCLKFSREEFQSLVRQFNRLRQVGSVCTYAEKFSELMHNLHAHHSSWNSEFFVTQFLDGLQADIRSAVVLHRPVDLDTAVDLACLQEEVLETNRREARQVDFSSNGRLGAKPSVPVHPRPGAGPGPRVDDRRQMEELQTPVVDEKLAALRAYCRAKGLCHTCGEKWSRDHKCGPTVQLHVLEELWEMLDDHIMDSDIEPEAESSEPVQSADSELCQISREAVLGLETTGTLRLQGWVQQHEVLMLVAYGSTHSFISEDMAAQLSGRRQGFVAVKVRVADGGLLQRTQELVDCIWWVQGIFFHSNLKILPLGTYDAILGMDWLESHGPMQVDWREKTLKFQYNQQRVCLRGVRSDVSHCAGMSASQVKGLLHHHSVLQTVELCLIEQETL